jgi:hypothetical protein
MLVTIGLFSYLFVPKLLIPHLIFFHTYNEALDAIFKINISLYFCGLCEGHVYVVNYYLFAIIFLVSYFATCSFLKRIARIIYFDK